MIQARILVVEDDEIIALDIHHKLERLGYAVCDVVNSGEEAIRQAANLQPDLVLMDIRLKGGMDGVEAAAHIRTLLQIPVIFTTAHTDVRTLGRAKLTDPIDYVFKPLEECDLSSAVEKALSKRKSEVKHPTT